jgi:hypothetical protein
VSRAFASGEDDGWLLVTFGTARGVAGRVTFIPMEAIVTIASYAAMICPVALIGLLWRWAKRADKVETETLMPTRGSPERRQK